MKNKNEIKIESNNGQVVAIFDATTFELLELSDWNGNDLSGTKWEDAAIEKGLELLAASQDSYKDFT